MPDLLEIDSCLALRFAPRKLLAVNGRLFRLKYLVRIHKAEPPSVMLKTATFCDKFNPINVA